MVRFDIITLFPGMFDGPLDDSIIGRARRNKIIEIYLHDLRQYAHDNHRTVDSNPFGGGAGMLLMPGPLFEAVDDVSSRIKNASRTVAMSASGRPLSQEVITELIEYPNLILVCGRYEGMDERFLQNKVHDEISVGDFIVSGGELPAMVLIDALTRQLEGVLGSSHSLTEESFGGGLLEYPQYARPANYEGWEVPSVLLSGDHLRIAHWREMKRLERTIERRPDLLEDVDSAKSQLKNMYKEFRAD